MHWALLVTVLLVLFRPCHPSAAPRHPFYTRDLADRLIDAIISEAIPFTALALANKHMHQQFRLSRVLERIDSAREAQEYLLGAHLIGCIHTPMVFSVLHDALQSLQGPRERALLCLAMVSPGPLGFTSFHMNPAFIKKACKAGGRVVCMHAWSRELALYTLKEREALIFLRKHVLKSSRKYVPTFGKFVKEMIESWWASADPEARMGLISGDLPDGKLATVDWFNALNVKESFILNLVNFF